MKTLMKLSMNTIQKQATGLMQDESGQNLIEYALLACLIGLASIAALTTVGQSISTLFYTLLQRVAQAM